MDEGGRVPHSWGVEKEVTQKRGTVSTLVVVWKRADGEPG